MRFTISKTDKDFVALKEGWQTLLANSDANALFSSYTLAAIFWKTYGKGNALRVVSVYNADQLIGIFPLYIRYHCLLKVFPVRTLRLIGTGGDVSFDYLGGIVHKEYAQHYGSLFGQAINQLWKEWDLCELEDMQCPVEALQVRRECTGGLLHAANNERSIILAELKESWDDYLAKLSSNRRQQIRRARRKMFEQENIQLDQLTNAEQLKAWFDSLVRLHHKRQQQKGEDDYSFQTEQYNAFHQAFMASALDNNTLRLWGLKKDGNLIAILYCLSDGGTTYYYQGGFDTDYDELKPGMVLMSCAMEEAIKEGCGHFDMMKGDYDFKRSLAKEENHTFGTRLIRPTFSGLIYMLRVVVLSRLKAAIFQ